MGVLTESGEGRGQHRLYPTLVKMVQTKLRFEEGSYEGEVNESKIPEGPGVFNYRGDDEHGRMCYDGDWKNKAAHGYGSMKWQNGDRYEGDWVDGVRQGKGKYVSKSSGGVYDGEYRNDKKDGSGKYVWSNGDWYEGEWKQGLRHGQGVYVWKDKNEKYDGEWKDGIKEGSGKFIYANGDIFTGPYVSGNRHGSGQLVKSDGEERSENYKEGKLVNFTVTKNAS